MLIEAFTPDQAERYDMFRRVKLRKDQVRRVRGRAFVILSCVELTWLQLINHILSQSVPPSVVVTVMGSTKVLLGELIERGRGIQAEWQATSETFPSGKSVPDDTSLDDRTKVADRGPLTPDHIREALRRYKRDREGGSAGYLGASLRGTEVTAARAGNRRLFR
jgi:transcription initiation factor TFIID subunit 11